MDSVGNLLDRPRQYYNIDGVGELGLGFMFLAVALLQWLQATTPKDAIWHQMYLFIPYWSCMCLVIHYGSKAIKKHVTYPRTGFVEYSKWETRWRPAIVGAVVAIPVTAGLAIALRSHWNLSAPRSFLGLLLAASYIYGFARTVRWKWAVAAILTIGSIAIALLPTDVLSAVARDASLPREISVSVAATLILTFFLYGVTCSMSGGISFWLYLRHTQAPSQEVE